MDPLSITASTVTLIQVAGTVATSLQRFVHSLKTADSRITELCNELASLTAFLGAVERTLKGCHPLDTTHVNEDLWHQSELCLVDCQVTLNELAVLVDKIKCSTSTRTFGWRLRAVVDLSAYGSDIGIFRDRIHKSNWALQTLLHTVTVSLSLRNNASQDMILFELDRLKVSIDEALLASRKPRQGFNHSLSSDSRVARNLRNLAEAARHFHSAASSTASTIRDHSGSLLGDFPAHRRERVETFIRTAGRHASGHETPSTIVSAPADSVSVVTSSRSLRVSASASRWPVVEDDEDDEAEFEQHFLDGLEDLAKDSIRRREFEKAIGFLTEAIQRKEKASSGKGDLPRLQTQLALCYLFGDDWKKAEPIVSVLANRKEAFSCLGPVVWTMLHALALAYLSTYSFDDALKMCKRAFHAQGKWAKMKQLERRDVEGCAETTGLLATIFHMEGDYIAAEIYRRQLPQDFLYNHCSDPREFLSSQYDLLEDVLGEDLPDPYDYSPLDGPLNIPKLWINTQHSMRVSIQRPTTVRKTLTVNGGDLSPLRARRRQWEKFEMDTNKEVVVLTPDPIVGTEDKAASTASDNPRSTTITSGFRRRATRMFETGRGLHRVWCRWSAEIDYAASSTPSPIRRWLKETSVLSVKPVRTLLRKRPNNDTTPAVRPRWEGPTTFRGLPISRPIIADSSEWCPTFRLPVGHPATILDDNSTPEPACEGHFTPGNAADDKTGATDVIQDHNSEGEQVTPEISGVPEQPTTHHVAKPSKSPRSAALVGTSFSVASQKQAFDQADSLDVLRGYLLIPQEQFTHPSCEKDEVLRLDSPILDSFPKWTTPESRSVSEKNHSNTARATSVSKETNEKNITTQPSRPSKKAGPTHHHGRNMPGHGFARRRANPMPTTAALPQEETAVLSRLADILASLAVRDGLNADKLHAAKLELEALSVCLERWNTDSILRYDLQTVIKSLPSHPTGSTAWDELQDSGYSSAGYGSSETLSSSDATSLRSERVSQESKSQGTDHEKGIRPKQQQPKRRLSLMARGDARDRSKSGDLQRPKSHSKDSPDMDSVPSRSKWRGTFGRLSEVGKYGKEKNEIEEQLAVANSGVKLGPSVVPVSTPRQPDIGNFF